MGSYCIPSCITHQPLHTCQILLKSKKLSVGQTYVQGAIQPRVGFGKQLGFKPRVKREGVKDEQSGESEKEEVSGEGTGELEMEELVPE